jgi:adhesin HecA-like repeat protein
MARTNPVTSSALALVLLAGVACAARSARAQGVLSMWDGPWNGNFNAPGNWTNFSVPDSPGEYFVIDSGSAVLSSSILVDKFGLINSSFLSISNSLALGVLSRPANGQETHTGIFGGGTINMNAAQYGTLLYITGGQPGDFAIHGDAGLGNSFIRMSDSPNNIIYTNTPGLILINEGVIEGAGQVGYNSLAIQNSRLAGGPRAMIMATRPNNPLVIDPPATPFRNIDSILRAEGGVLILRNGTFVNEQGAVIEIGSSSANSAVHLDGARVQGGLLAAPSGWAFLAYNNSTLADLSLTGRLRLLNSHQLFLEGTVLVSATGTIELEAFQYGTVLNAVHPATTLTGAGQMLLSNSPNNIIYTSVAGSTLTNNLLYGIRGSGQLGYNALFVTNNTAVYAQGSAGLVIDPPAAGFDNNGSLFATVGSTLTLRNGTFDNTGGLISADQGGGSVVLDGARIDFGLLQGGITALNNSRVANLSVMNDSALRVANSHHLFTEGVITNHGGIFLDAAQYGTILNATSTTNTYAGSGEIVLSNSPNNIIYTTTGGATLTLNLTGGLRGSGQLGYNSLTVINNSTVAAQGSNGLSIDPPASGFDNNGILRADAGSTLTIRSGTIDNTGGQIVVNSSATASSMPPASPAARSAPSATLLSPPPTTPPS